jgi:hypothetical protein
MGESPNDVTRSGVYWPDNPHARRIDKYRSLNASTYSWSVTKCCMGHPTKNVMTKYELRCYQQLGIIVYLETYIGFNIYSILKGPVLLPGVS